MIRNGITYDRMIRNGVTYDRMIRNGVTYGQSEPDPGYNWRAGLNLSFDGAVSDDVAGWNTLRPVLTTGTIPNPSVFTSLKDMNGNNLIGMQVTITTASVVAENTTGPSLPDPNLYNQRWRSNATMRLNFEGLDNTKRYTVQVLTQEAGATAGQVISTYTYVLANNQLVEDVARDATLSTPNSIEFTDESWVRFDEIIPVGGIFRMNIARNGSLARSVTHAIILTEYDIAIDGVQTFHVAGVTDSPIPYVGYVPNGTGPKPAFIFLHGSGERGTGSAASMAVLVNKFGPSRSVAAGTFKHDAYVFSPQCPSNGYWSDYPTQGYRDYLNYLQNTYDIDPNKIYFIGYSDGALGIGSMLNDTVGDRIFKAAVTLASDPRGYKFKDMPSWAHILPANLTGVPVWVFANSNDPTSASADTIAGVAEVNALDSGIEKVTVFTGYTHTFIQKVLNGTGMGTMISGSYDPFDESIYDWLLRH